MQIVLYSFPYVRDIFVCFLCEWHHCVCLFFIKKTSQTMQNIRITYRINLTVKMPFFVWRLPQPELEWILINCLIWNYDKLYFPNAVSDGRKRGIRVCIHHYKFDCRSQTMRYSLQSLHAFFATVFSCQKAPMNYM